MNEPFKRLGNTLIEKGVWFLKNAFQVKPQTTTSQYLKNLVFTKTGIPIANIWGADDTYFYTDLATIKDILRYDLADEKEYEAEKFDCDDFAATIYAIFRYVFEINTMGIARNVKLVNPQNDQLIAYHRTNIFLATENNILKLFLLEPQTDQIVEIEKGKDLILNNQKYILGNLDF